MVWKFLFYTQWHHNDKSVDVRKPIYVYIYIYVCVCIDPHDTRMRHSADWQHLDIQTAISDAPKD